MFFRYISYTHDFSHADSLYQPPLPANCLNRVLGHIVSRRNVDLELLGEESLWLQDVQERNQTVLEPVVSGERARLFVDFLGIGSHVEPEAFF